MNLLTELYRISSPSHKEWAMVRFLCGALQRLGVPYRVDELGNVYATKGVAKTYPCVVAHTDEVHGARSKHYRVVWVEDELVFGFDTKRNKFCGLGADDKNGIWVCLKCLEEFDVLKCVFFVGEETGCRGSMAAELDFFADCRFVVQCDRKGSSDVVRWANFRELCSAEFMAAIDPKKYGYAAAEGTTTDVWALKQRGLGVSCVNVSCGYYNPHTDTELTRWSDLQKCLDFVRHIVRDCTDRYPHTSYDGFYGDWGVDECPFDLPNDKNDYRQSKKQMKLLSCRSK